jgi:hypothetical protein
MAKLEAMRPVSGEGLYTRQHECESAIQMSLTRHTRVFHSIAVTLRRSAVRTEGRA